MDELLLLLHKTVVSCQLCTMATLHPSNILLYQPNRMLNELQDTPGLCEEKNHCATTELNLACQCPILTRLMMFVYS
jgi:hypothetical protein